MITAVDTSVLLDVLADDAVHAELVPTARDHRQLDGWLQQAGIRITALTAEHGYAAGVAHAAYRKAGGKRDRILADFLIGAHALHEANRFLTRDRGFYRKYFSGLEILEA